MAETKTLQKNWKFTPEIIAELDQICFEQRRSAQNMVEVLIHNEFIKAHPPVDEKAQGS